MLSEIQCTVPHLLPEAGGGNVLGTIVDIVAEVDHDRHLGFQQAIVLLGADLRRSTRLDSDDGGNILHRYVPTNRTTL